MDVIGIRPGEKLHEVLISEDEARNTVELEKMFVVNRLRRFGLVIRGRSTANYFRMDTVIRATTIRNGWT